MIVCTKQVNSGTCPHWKVHICVSGLYGERPDGSCTFLRAQCPIIENAKLPPYKQDHRYKYMICPDPNSCILYTQFQPFTTSDI